MFFVTSAPAADVADSIRISSLAASVPAKSSELVGASSCEFYLDRFGYFSVVEQTQQVERGRYPAIEWYLPITQPHGSIIGIGRGLRQARPDERDRT